MADGGPPAPKPPPVTPPVVPPVPPVQPSSAAAKPIVPPYPQFSQLLCLNEIGLILSQNFQVSQTKM